MTACCHRLSPLLVILSKGLGVKNAQLQSLRIGLKSWSRIDQAVRPGLSRRLILREFSIPFRQKKRSDLLGIESAIV
jgi:hypothetical protein